MPVVSGTRIRVCLEIHAHQHLEVDAVRISNVFCSRNDSARKLGTSQSMLPTWQLEANHGGVYYLSSYLMPTLMV
jgi:hypothetical protein